MGIVSEDIFIDFINNLPNNNSGVALDIGANYGIYTKLLVSKFERVIAFEPHPKNFRILFEKSVVGYYDDVNVQYVNKAVSDKTGIIPLYDEVSHGQYTTSQALAESRKWGHNPNLYFYVDAVTLDEFCWGVNVKLLKVDVEGAEGFVFNGAIETLKRANFILWETHPFVDLEKYYKLFLDLGYIIDTDFLEADQHYIFVKNKQ